MAVIPSLLVLNVLLSSLSTYDSDKDSGGWIALLALIALIALYGLAIYAAFIVSDGPEVYGLNKSRLPVLAKDYAVLPNTLLDWIPRSEAVAFIPFLISCS